MANQKQQKQLDGLLVSKKELRLDLIRQIGDKINSAKEIMKRNFTPSEEELDLDSWGFDDD